MRELAQQPFPEMQQGNQKKVLDPLEGQGYLRPKAPQALASVPYSVLSAGEKALGNPVGLVGIPPEAGTKILVGNGETVVCGV